MIQKFVRVLCALPVLGQPRHSKRIDMLTDEGVIVEIVAFERDYHSGRKPKSGVSSLGKIEHGGYFRRLWSFLIAIPEMRRLISRNEIVYAFGSDMAYLSILAGIGLHKPVVLEIGDIRDIQVSKGYAGRIIRMIDRFFIERCALLVVTSKKYATEYYQGILKTSTPAILMENKIERSFVSLRDLMKEKNKEHKGDLVSERPMRIGYFGLLRCEWSWRVLTRLAEAQPSNVEIILAGYAVLPVNLESNAFSNVFFRGEYRSPEDLPQLYGDVDLVWASYPRSEKGKNQNWARTNRFYESAFFGKPMVSRAFSSDADDIVKYDIGYCITSDRDEDVVRELLRIGPEDIRRWSNNLRSMPQEIYVYTDEPSRLKRALQYLSERKSLTDDSVIVELEIIR